MKKTTRTSAKKRVSPEVTAETAAVVVEEPAEAAEAATEAEGAEGASKTVAALKLKDLVEMVVASTGAKKKNAKEIVEATLTQLGAALADGKELNLPGFGKVRVQKSANKADGQSMMTLKMRSAKPQRKKDAAEPLAEAEEAV